MLSIYDNFHDKPFVRSRSSTNPINQSLYQLGRWIQVHPGTSNPWTLGPNTRQVAGGMDLNDIPKVYSLHLWCFTCPFFKRKSRKFHFPQNLFISEFSRLVNYCYDLMYVIWPDLAMVSYMKHEKGKVGCRLIWIHWAISLRKSMWNMIPGNLMSSQTWHCKTKSSKSLVILPRSIPRHQQSSITSTANSRVSRWT